MKHISYLLIILSFSAYADKFPANLKETKSQISFTENKGQICDQNYKPRTDVLFSGTDGQLTFHVKNNGISYQLNRVDKWKEEENGKTKEKIKIPDQTTIYRIDANWLNANPNTIKETDETLSGYNNYYLEQCPNGALNVKSYKGITLKNVYDNINLHYYAKEGVLKYDYIVAPRTNYKQIQIEIKGADIKINEDGSLLLKTPLGDILEGRPKAFQKGKELAAYWRISKNILSFEVEDCDPDLELVIDPPTRVWGTYYGGGTNDGCTSVFNDASSNVYIAGHTGSATGIATSGAYQNVYGGAGYDAFMAKFNSAGVLQWGTYYGGSTTEFGRSACIDVSGNVYIAGNVLGSNTVIATPGSHQLVYGGGPSDGFLVKFNSAGVRQWGTFYGGSSDEGAFTCAADASGNIFIAGYTTTGSSTTIATPGSHQVLNNGGNEGFLVKFDASGVRQWGTYYGGSGSDMPYGCATDASGSVFMVGITTTSVGTFIASAGSHQSSFGGSGGDAFLVKFNSVGVRQWGTYYGGPNNDDALSCSTDPSGNIYMTGSSSSSVTNVIATAGSHQSTFGGSGTLYDAYLVKFNSAGVRQWGTYYGGSANDTGTDCFVDSNNDIILLGNTYSTGGNIIATSGSHQINYAGGTGYDAYVAKFDALGVRKWGTYYGGIGDDSGNSCSADLLNNIYISGGCNTISGTAIATPGSHQSIYAGSSDGFLVRLNDCIPDQPAPIIGASIFCEGGGSQTYSVAPIANADYYTWSLPSGWTGTSTTNIISVTPGTSGGTMSITATNTCGTTPADVLTITVNPQPTIAINNSTICIGQSFTMAPTGASTYTFSSGSAVVSPTTGTSYYITGTNSLGCVSSNTAVCFVVVIPLPTVFASATGSACPGTNGCLVASGPGLTSFTWVGPCGFTSNVQNPCFPFNTFCSCTYSVFVTAVNGCTNMATTCLSIYPSATITAITSNSLICGPPFSGTASLTASGATSYTWNTSSTSSVIAVSPSVTTTYSVTGSDANGCQNTATITQSVSACTNVTLHEAGNYLFEIFPNPTNGFVTVVMNKHEVEWIEIYNLIGEKIFRLEIKENRTEIDLSQQAAGIYFIKIGGITKKVVKE